MKKKNVILNYLYNSLYQLLIIITPIITTPYISRVIGAEGIGVYSSTLGVAQLFNIFGMFGILNYGSRAIAYVRDDKEKLNHTFWNVWIIQCIFSFISLIMYWIIFISFDSLGLSKVYLIQLPVVLGSLFDISWFYVGVEDFKKTVSRNVMVKIIGIICIFLFVKTESDLNKYIAINSISTFLGVLTLWIFLKEYISKIEFKDFKYKFHIRSALLLFIPQLTTHFYTGLDRTIIGLLSNSVEVGLYDQSQKVSRIALSLVTSLSTVLMPRIANMFANKDNEKIGEYLYKSINFTLLISCWLMTGIISVTKDFVPIFFGEDFIGIEIYMIFTSLIVLFIPFGGVFANQYALPTGRTKEYIFPLIQAAVINIVLNIIITPKLGALGGVISIILTEFITMATRILLLKKYLNIRKLLEGSYIYILAAVLSFSITLFIGDFLKGGIISVLIEGIICTLIYSILIIKFSPFYKNEVRSIVLSKIKERKIIK